MRSKAWDEFKVRKLTKQDYKAFNRAVDKLADETVEFKLRDSLKWSIIAVLDELETIDDDMERIQLSEEFDKHFPNVRKPIKLAPVTKPIALAPCTQIEKDYTFKLMS